MNSTLFCRRPITNFWGSWLSCTRKAMRGDKFVECSVKARFADLLEGREEFADQQSVRSRSDPLIDDFYEIDFLRAILLIGRAILYFAGDWIDNPMLLVTPLARGGFQKKDANEADRDFLQRSWHRDRGICDPPAVDKKQRS